MSTPLIAIPAPSAGISLPLAVADGGTDGTDQATARAGLGLGSAAVEALTTDGTTVTGALGAADRRVLSPRGATTGRGIPTGAYFSNTTISLVALRVEYVALDTLALADWARLQFEVTSLSAGNARIGVYTSSAGRPAAKIWDSGSVSVGSTGVKNVAFTAGTWSDTSYQSGDNFRPKRLGERLFVAIQSDTGVTPSVRATTVAGLPIIEYDPAIGGNAGLTRGRETPGSFGLPASVGTVTYDSNAATLFMPLAP